MIADHDDYAMQLNVQEAPISRRRSSMANGILMLS